MIVTTISEQISLFYGALFVGLFVGVVYDCFRLLRLFWTNGHHVIIFCLDVLFFLVFSLIVSVYLFYAASGKIRGYAITGVFVGFFVYLLTLGRLTLPAEQKLTLFCRWLFHLFIRPIIAGYRHTFGVLRQKRQKKKISAYIRQLPSAVRNKIV